MDRNKLLQSFSLENYKSLKNQAELRKSKRMSEGFKRRNLNSDASWIDLAANFRENYSVSDLPMIIQSGFSSEDFLQLLSAQALHKLSLSLHFQEIIDSGGILILIKCIQRFDFPQLQYESICALRNISSDHPSVVVNRGGLPHIMNLLANNYEEIVEEAASTLGNLSKKSVFARTVLEKSINVLIDAGFTENKNCERSALLALCVVCKKAENYESVKLCVPALCKGLTDDDKELSAEVCLALEHLVKIQTDNFEVLAQSFHFIFKLAKSTYLKIQSCALRCIRLIVLTHPHVIIEHDGLDLLVTTINSKHRIIRRESIEIIKKLCRSYLRMLIESGLINTVIENCTYEEFEVQQESSKLIYVYLKVVTSNQEPLILNDTLKTVLQLFIGFEDQTMILYTLKAIKVVLKSDMYYYELFNDLGIIEYIETLQEHKNSEIYKLAFSILKNQDEKEDDLLTTVKNSFNF